MKLLNMNQTAKFLGITGTDLARRTRNYLLAIEKDRDMTLLTKIGSRYFTTEAALRTALPSLIAPDPLCLQLQTQLINLTETFLELKKRLNARSSDIRDLKADLAGLRQVLNSWAED